MIDFDKQARELPAGATTQIATALRAAYEQGRTVERNMIAKAIVSEVDNLDMVRGRTLLNIFDNACAAVDQMRGAK